MASQDNATVIRPASESDLATIVDYNLRLARESESKELDPAVLRPGVQLALRRPDLCRYFIAEVDGQPIGQTMLTYELTDWRNGVLWWVQSVYVVPEHRGRGAFRALFEHIESEAHRDPSVRGIRLYVEEGNTPARRVYEKLGMAASGYRVYEKEW